MFSSCRIRTLEVPPPSNMPPQAFQCLTCSKTFRQRGSLIRHRAHSTTCGVQRIKFLNRLVLPISTRHPSLESDIPGPPDTHTAPEIEGPQHPQALPPTSSPLLAPQSLPISSRAASAIPQDNASTGPETRYEPMNML